MKQFLDKAMRPDKYYKIKIIAGAKVAKTAHNRPNVVRFHAPQPR